MTAPAGRPDLRAEPALLIYDGNCPLCQRARRWLEQRIPPDRLETLPCQDPERSRRAPMVSLEACLEAMQLVLPDGRRFAAEKAFPPLLALMPGGRFFAWCFALPGTGWAYRRIARNRLAISALLFRKAPGERCSRDEGCK